MNIEERLRGILTDSIVLGLINVPETQFIIRWIDGPIGSKIVGQGTTIQEAILSYDEWYADNYKIDNLKHQFTHNQFSEE